MHTYCKGIYNYTGTNRMWILDNFLQLKRKIDECNNNMTSHCISTWVFSTLYTTIRHQLLKDTISELKKNNKNYIAFKSFWAFWSVREVKRYKCLTAQDLKDYVVNLIDNIYVILWNLLHQQVVHIPMGISSTPLLAKLFLWCMNMNLWKTRTGQYSSSTTIQLHL